VRRYDNDRRLGYKDEAVSSMEGRHRDRMAAAAEKWVARALGPDARLVAGTAHRDPGWDIVFRGHTIDVKWTQQEPGGPWKTPQYPGLRVPTWKPRRAALYVLVIGALEDRFDLFAWADGWTTRQEVEAAKVIDLGKVRKTTGRGAPFFFVGFDYLRPLEELQEIVRK
jgi:hypothetical protein